MRARGSRAVVSALVLLLTISGHALAQTPAPAAPPPPPPHEGTAEFSFVGPNGNSDTTAFGLAGEFIARTAPWVFTTKAAFVQNEAEGELKARSFRGGFRAERSIDRLSASRNTAICVTRSPASNIATRLTAGSPTFWSSLIQYSDDRGRSGYATRSG